MMAQIPFLVESDSTVSGTAKHGVSEINKQIILRVSMMSSV